MKAIKIINIIKDIQSSNDKESIKHLSLPLPEELSKVRFLEPIDLSVFLFDLQVKKYIYEEVKNHYTVFTEATKDDLTTLIMYLETLSIYEE